MIWTVYLDESGTHDSPIMLMGGFLANEDQWKRFNDEWHSLLNASGVQYCHGKELVQGTGQFKNCPINKRLAFQDEANRIILKHLELGVTAVIRQDDYDSIYKSAPNPQKLRKDTKFSILFRGGCSLFLKK
jgi:hypothetical protein